MGNNRELLKREPDPADVRNRLVDLLLSDKFSSAISYHEPTDLEYVNSVLLLISKDVEKLLKFGSSQPIRVENNK